MRENRTPGSVRGLSGNWQSYRDQLLATQTTEILSQQHLILAMICFLTLTVSIVQSQEQGADSNRRASKSQRPSVNLIQQESSQVILKISPVKSIPEKPGLVKITFKAEGAKTVKGYHFHYEENFVDKDGARGSVVTDSTALRTLGREELLHAHENAEIRVWVSEVEYMDGSRWKSALIPKLNPRKQSL